MSGHPLRLPVSKKPQTITLRYWLLLFLFVFPFVIRAAEVPAKAGKLIKVRVSQSTLNTRAAILWIAQAQGLFAKYGVEAETVFLASSNIQTAALATGEVQIGTIGGATVLSGVAGGQSFRIVASYQDLLTDNEKKPYPSIDAQRNVQKLMAAMNPKVASLKPEEIVEPRIIRRLDESGFIDSLYDSKKR